MELPLIAWKIIAGLSGLLTAISLLYGFVTWLRIPKNWGKMDVAFAATGLMLFTLGTTSFLGYTGFSFFGFSVSSLPGVVAAPLGAYLTLIGVLRPCNFNGKPKFSLFRGR